MRLKRIVKGHKLVEVETEEEEIFYICDNCKQEYHRRYTCNYCYMELCEKCNPLVINSPNHLFGGGIYICKNCYDTKPIMKEFVDVYNQRKEVNTKYEQLFSKLEPLVLKIYNHI
jgi:DNA-directed RNA polymerase subunit M/transcription elongation factor TFIIS